MCQNSMKLITAVTSMKKCLKTPKFKMVVTLDLTKNVREVNALIFQR